MAQWMKCLPYEDRPMFESQHPCKASIALIMSPLKKQRKLATRGRLLNGYAPRSLRILFSIN